MTGGGRRLNAARRARRRVAQIRGPGRAFPHTRARRVVQVLLFPSTIIFSTVHEKSTDRCLRIYQSARVELDSVNIVATNICVRAASVGSLSTKRGGQVWSYRYRSHSGSSRLFDSYTKLIRSSISLNCCALREWHSDFPLKPHESMRARRSVV